MRCTVKIFSILFLIGWCTHTKANENALWDSANAAYAKANYTKAVLLYDSILKSGNVAPEVYYNLGNAYYKSNNISKAILNYERAIKIEPHNDDFNFNLKLANQKIEDKIDAAPQLFLTQWKNSLVDLMAESGWATWCILSLVIALALLGLFIVSRHSGFKQLGFFGAAVFFSISISSFFLAKNKYNLTINGSEAIITASSVTITGSPTDKSTKLFILHEGTKVNITEEENEWCEIKIANGNTGWIKKTQLERI